MKVDDDTCDDFLTAYPLSKFLPNVSGGVGIGGLILGLVYFLSASAAIFWIHQQRKKAMLGMSGAAKHVVLPFYIPLLYLSAISDTFVGLVIFFINTRFEEGNTWTSSTVLASAFAFQHLVIEGTAFILMQYGCGYQAVINTTTWGIIWAISTFFVYLIIYKDGNQTAYIVEACWNAVLIVFYGTLWLTPETTLFRRTAVIFYSRFWAIIRVGIMFATVSVHFGSDYFVFTGDCVYDLLILPVFIILKPFVLYKALLIDSQWWQGLEAIGTSSRQHSDSNSGRSLARYYVGSDRSGFNFVFRWMEGTLRYWQGYHPVHLHAQDADVEQSNHHNTGTHSDHKYEAIRGPLLGVEVGYSEAQGLAREVDTMHKQGTIKLLNFAYLKVDQKAKLGAGSFSTVYMGMYKNTPVAIKMLVTLDLNPDVIKRCNNEARILTEVSPHPNVVTIYGLAVLPPSVCLVLEVCEFGSLSDVLRGCGAAGHIRHPLKLTLADRMYLALGCVKGLQALHAYSPNLCHRDIKSFNFLIDSQLNAKIADLDLGDDVHTPASGAGMKKLLSHHNNSSLSDDTPVQKMANYTGTNMTWQAPEVLLGMGYTQRSDIYSLGLVLWEIIAAGKTTKKFSTVGGGGDLKAVDTTYDSVPYSECKNQEEVREKIVRGFRPSVQGFSSRASNMNATSSKSRTSLQEQSNLSGMSNPYVTNQNVDDLYLDVLRHCWSADPHLRPRLSEIIQILEQCHAGALHQYIHETCHIVNADIVHAEHIRTSYLSGHQANHRQSSSYTDNPHLNHHFMNTLSAEFMTNLSILKAESRWSLLDNNTFMNYVILLAKPPYYVIYANKKFLQTTGFALYDLLAQEVDLVVDGKASEVKLKAKEKLRSVQENGAVEHIVMNLTRRDGKEIQSSCHFYPIYQEAQSLYRYYDTNQANQRDRKENEEEVGMFLNPMIDEKKSEEQHLHNEQDNKGESKAEGHDEEDDEEVVSERSNSMNWTNQIQHTNEDQKETRQEYSGNSESEFLLDEDLLKLIGEDDTVSSNKQQTSYNKFHVLNSSNKELAANQQMPYSTHNSSQLANSQSFSFSKSNLLSGSSNKKRKVRYIVMECSPIR